MSKLKNITTEIIIDAMECARRWYHGASPTALTTPEQAKPFAERVIAALNAHIEGCKPPETGILTYTEYAIGYYHGWDAALDEYRKKLLESLE